MYQQIYNKLTHIKNAHFYIKTSLNKTGSTYDLHY